jgi:hypothetical protein
MILGEGAVCCLEIEGKKMHWHLSKELVIGGARKRKHKDTGTTFLSR